MERKFRKNYDCEQNNVVFMKMQLEHALKFISCILKYFFPGYPQKREEKHILYFLSLYIYNAFQTLCSTNFLKYCLGKINNAKETHF